MICFLLADATGVSQIHRVNLPNDFVKNHAHRDIRKRKMHGEKKETHVKVTHDLARGINEVT